MTNGMRHNDGNALLLAFGKAQIDAMLKMQTDDLGITLDDSVAACVANEPADPACNTQP